MVSETDLEKCIDLLAKVSTNVGKNDRDMLLEVGYIIKTELDWVRGLRQPRSIMGIHPSKLDTRKLVEDNVSLSKDNAQIIEANKKLMADLNTKIPSIERLLTTVAGKLDKFNKILEDVRNGVRFGIEGSDKTA